MGQTKNDGKWIRKAYAREEMGRREHHGHPKMESLAMTVLGEPRWLFAKHHEVG
jgi:hypothetical protein